MMLCFLTLMTRYNDHANFRFLENTDWSDPDAVILIQFSRVNSFLSSLLQITLSCIDWVAFLSSGVCLAWGWSERSREIWGSHSSNGKAQKVAQSTAVSKACPCPPSCPSYKLESKGGRRIQRKLTMLPWYFIGHCLSGRCGGLLLRVTQDWGCQLRPWGFHFHVACENIRFSSLFAAGTAGDVSRGETSPAAKREEKRMFSQANHFSCSLWLKDKHVLFFDALNFIFVSRITWALIHLEGPWKIQW